MYNGRHISFKRVLYRAMDHSNAEDLTEEQAAEHAFRLIRNTGIGLAYQDKTQYKVIIDNRVSLPNDMLYLRGMRYHVVPEDMAEEDDEVEFFEKFNAYYQNKVNWLPIKYSGNIYQSAYHCEDYLDYDCDDQITYTINGNYAFVSEPTGAIQISYRGLMLDDDGLPMIPDNQPFEDALYYYILKEHFFPLVGVGKISQYFFEKIEQEYAWAVGKAQNSLQLSGMDHWESTMNGIRRLIQHQNLSDYGFKELSRREKIKKSF